jgi:hypothetical protein
VYFGQSTGSGGDGPKTRPGASCRLQYEPPHCGPNGYQLMPEPAGVCILPSILYTCMKSQRRARRPQSKITPAPSQLTFGLMNAGWFAIRAGLPFPGRFWVMMPHSVAASWCVRLRGHPEAQQSGKWYPNHLRKLPSTTHVWSHPLVYHR